jgi:hypothetical protein
VARRIVVIIGEMKTVAIRLVFWTLSQLEAVVFLSSVVKIRMNKETADTAIQSIYEQHFPSRGIGRCFSSACGRETWRAACCASVGMVPFSATWEL